MLPILRSLHKVYGPISVIHFDAHLVRALFLAYSIFYKLKRTHGVHTQAQQVTKLALHMEPFFTLLEKKVYFQTLVYMAEFVASFR